MYKTTDGWASDPTAQALRIELSGEHSLLLPFDQLVYAEMDQEEGFQRLRVVFATHEVSLLGHALRRLLTALQTKELAFVGLLPEPVRAGIPDGQPVLHRIIITETQNQ